MIGIIFKFGVEVVEVRVDGSKVFFRNNQSQVFADIGGIKLDKQGVLKEFPDLKDNSDWQKIARERFKEKIKKMKTESERAKYIIEDLIKFGYEPMYMQRKGFRPVKL